MFSGLSSLGIEDVADRDGVIVVRARTARGPVPCPRRGVETGHAITCTRRAGSMKVQLCGLEIGAPDVVLMTQSRRKLRNGRAG